MLFPVEGPAPSLPCAHGVEINSIKYILEELSGHTGLVVLIYLEGGLSSGREAARLSDPGWNSPATGVCGQHG